MDATLKIDLRFIKAVVMKFRSPNDVSRIESVQLYRV